MKYMNSIKTPKNILTKFYKQTLTHTVKLLKFHVWVKCLECNLCGVWWFKDNRYKSTSVFLFSTWVHKSRARLTVAVREEEMLDWVWSFTNRCTQLRQNKKTRLFRQEPNERKYSWAWKYTKQVQKKGGMTFFLMKKIKHLPPTEGILLGHNQNLMTIGEGRNKDGTVNRKLCSSFLLRKGKAFSLSFWSPDSSLSKIYHNWAITLGLFLKTN